MRKVIVAVGVLAAPVVCHAQQQLDLSRPAEQPFQCGAAFAIVEQAYSDAGNAADTAKFRATFQKLAAQVRIDAPLFSHTLFGLYLGLLLWSGLWLRSPALRAIFPVGSGARASLDVPGNREGASHG